MKDGPEIQEWDPEWLVRRGNYMTLVTPELAELLLRRNENNRKPKPNAIAKYKRDMLGGKWDPDASDLKTSRTGKLIDGQNRLMACIEGQVPFPTLIRTCLADSARDHVDQGVKRTISDSLKMAGVTDPNGVATAVSLRMRYDKALASGRGVTKEMRVMPTHQEALDYLAAHPMIEKTAGLGRGMANYGPGVTRTVYMAAISMFAEASEGDAREFARCWIEGDMEGAGDPLLALTRYVAVQQAPAQTRVRDRMAAEKHLLAFVKAWNAWRLEEPLDKLVLRDGEQVAPAV